MAFIGCKSLHLSAFLRTLFTLVHALGNPLHINKGKTAQLFFILYLSDSDKAFKLTCTQVIMKVPNSFAFTFADQVKVWP